MLTVHPCLLLSMLIPIIKCTFEYAVCSGSDRHVNTVSCFLDVHCFNNSPYSKGHLLRKMYMYKCVSYKIANFSTNSKVCGEKKTISRCSTPLVETTTFGSSPTRCVAASQIPATWHVKQGHRKTSVLMFDFTGGWEFTCFP